jgi:predicted Zn-dependent protease
MFRRFFTRRRLLRLATVLVVLGLIAPHAWAWSRLRAARAALASHHPEEARAALDSCRRVWGWDKSPAIHLAACRACWQTDDLEGAVRELRAAQRLTGKATEETAFEWALIQATAGNMTEVEPYLQRRADKSPGADGPVVWEALAAGYLRIYRTLDAMACLNHWLGRDPNNVRALELRGQTYVTGRGVVRGTEDYRRAIELDPTREATRRRLADALITLGGYEEAVAHLEVLGRAHPDDSGVAAKLARCYNFVGRRNDARRLLDATLARHPEDGLCLRTRGQLALMDDQKAEAEQWLRRAAAAMPEDYQAQWLLFEALRQQGKLNEANEQNRKADEVKERVSRLTELQSRRLAQAPLDPALHSEMGRLLMQTGRGEVGERWLLTALTLDPEHRPSHAALAAYYEGRGDRTKADFHRAKATERKE